MESDDRKISSFAILFWGIVIGCIGMHYGTILLESMQTPPPAYYIIDTKAEMKNGNVVTSKFRAGGPYSEYRECYDAHQQVVKTAGDNNSFSGGTDDFECKKMESADALMIPKGTFPRTITGFTPTAGSTVPPGMDHDCTYAEERGCFVPESGTSWDHGVKCSIPVKGVKIYYYPPCGWSSAKDVRLRQHDRDQQ